MSAVNYQRLPISSERWRYLIFPSSGRHFRLSGFGGGPGAILVPRRHLSTATPAEYRVAALTLVFHATIMVTKEALIETMTSILNIISAYWFMAGRSEWHHYLKRDRYRQLYQRRQLSRPCSH